MAYGNTTSPADGHCLGDQAHVVVVDLEQAEAELVAPALAVLDEIESVQQRRDRRFARRQVRNVAPPGHEAAAHVEGVRLAWTDAHLHGGQRLVVPAAPRVVGAGHGDPVPCMFHRDSLDVEGVVGAAS